MKSYFYNLLHKYIKLYVQPGNTLVEIHPQTSRLIRLFEGIKTAVVPSGNQLNFSNRNIEMLSDIESLSTFKTDYILLNGNIHYEQDIQKLLENVFAISETSSRIIICYYSALWKPIMRLATLCKLRDKTPEQNWVSHEDINNLLLLTGFEPIRRECRVILPVHIPFISNFLNRYLAPLPFFRIFTMVNILIARPLHHHSRTPSVSVIVPARNEAGNIEPLVTRIPKMGIDDELIFIEGHSSDDTWERIQKIATKYSETKNIKIAQQDGIGKGDAVRKGFAMASNEIFMILDADLTVPPEELPKFYHAIVSNIGEFINGSRLVYPMDDKAMRFFNMLGNKFFAVAFSFVLGQRFKDTLCGTKVLSRTNYVKIAKHRSYFGNFDPFGDFDLLFGASRLNLKIVEIPIRYRERVYGSTNIQRWKHGMLLLRMVIFAAKKIKFI